MCGWCREGFDESLRCCGAKVEVLLCCIDGLGLCAFSCEEDRESLDLCDTGICGDACMGVEVKCE